MRIAALSDFHIGSTYNGDCFRHDLASFARFLDRLEDQHDHIVLLGDVFQAEHGWRVGRSVARRELRRAMARAEFLGNRLSRSSYHYVHGNHDAIAGSELGAHGSLVLGGADYRVFFIHGHQFDPLLRRLYPLARASTWFSGRVRRLGLGAVSDWLEHHDIEIKHRRFRGPGGPYARAASALLRQHRAHVVVMGHTHVPHRTELADGVFANTGTCSLGQRMYVSIDTETRHVELITA